MAFNATQVSGGADGTNPTANFSSNPTAGRLCIAYAFSRSGTAHSSHSITINSASAVTSQKAHGYDHNLGDTTERCSLSVWLWKANGDEFVQGGVQVSGDTVRLQLVETDIDYDDKQIAAVIGNGGAAGFTSLSTGTTADVGSGSDYELISLIGWKNGATSFSDAVSAWTNGLTTVGSHIAGSHGRSITIAFDEDTAGGTKESTASMTYGADAANGGAAIMIVLEPAGAGGGGGGLSIPVAMHNYRRRRAA